MNHISPRREPRRVPQVEVELLRSALFIASEYLAELAAEAVTLREADGEDGEDAPLRVDTRALLSRLADDLGTEPKTTLALFLRVSAFIRLLAAAPKLAEIATEGGEEPTEEALVAAARLPLHGDAEGDGEAEFDPAEFRAALDEE